ncbi:MAG: hypothetical protein KC443_08335 [Anaerolineales bacterium]|nr:hypothetical protein [Anaerolineales bacterium]
MSEAGNWRRRWGWLLLVMLTAVFLRLHAITDAPPGLTHDEADHGLTAWRILDEDVHDIYFTIGYGREPLYDYLTAGLMAFIGRTYLAGRLTAVFASLLLVAGSYTWGRLAFNRQVGLLLMAGTAVGFWPVMSGRQMLRSTLLPTLFVLAVGCFWWGWRQLRAEEGRLPADRTAFVSRLQAPMAKFIAAGVLLGLTFYVYIPARVLWGVFPVLLGWLALTKRPQLRRVWLRVLLLLLVAGLVGLPLFRYLATHEEVEARIQELSTPLQALAQGDVRPIIANTLASMRLFTSQGDPTWRYNLPERPFLNPIMGGLFYMGLLVAVLTALPVGRGVWRLPRMDANASFFALAWLLAGMSPVFVTGPELSMTQAIGVLPVLYLFPALALAFLANLLLPQNGSLSRFNWRLAVGLFVPLLLFGGTAVSTYHDYFVTWANAPEVRVQYESTMVAMLDYVKENDAHVAAISTITPSWAHSPAVAQLRLDDSYDLHWFDGRSSLLLPAAPQTHWLFPGFAALPSALMPYLETAVLVDTLPLRDTDLDRPVNVYEAETATVKAQWQTQFTTTSDEPIAVGQALLFLGYDLPTAQVHPGDVVSVATLWQVQQAVPQAQLFVHLWDADGRPLAQADSLGVPGDQWRAGDWFIQLHQFTLPAETAVGAYQLVVGAYDPITLQRFPIAESAQATADTIFLTTLRVTP